MALCNASLEIWSARSNAQGAPTACPLDRSEVLAAVTATSGEVPARAEAGTAAPWCSRWRSSFSAPPAAAAAAAACVWDPLPLEVPFFKLGTDPP